MSNIKKYLKTGITLGLIAGISAGFIALANLVSSKKIIENEQNSIKSGIKSIFGEKADIKEERDLSGYEYTVHLYEVSNDSDEKLGYAFKCKGSNMYGKISLISGFDELSHSFKSLYLIKNEQTYASTLVDNYISPLNSSERDVEDVSCGATYGAKLVRDMINESKAVALELWK